MRALRSSGLPLLVFGLPAGVTAGLARGIIRGSATAGLATGLVVGATSGALLALVFGSLEMAGNRHVPPGLSSGPKQATTVPVRTDGDLVDRIRAALLALPADLRTADVPAGRPVRRAHQDDLAQLR